MGPREPKYTILTQILDQAEDLSRLKVKHIQLLHLPKKALQVLFLSSLLWCCKAATLSLVVWTEPELYLKFASFFGFQNFSSYLNIIFWLNMWLYFWQWGLQFLSDFFPLIRCNFLIKQKSDYQIFQSNIKISLSLPLIISF